MKVGEKKVKKILERFIILITFMLIAFLLYYFINTYNTIKVYKIDGMNDNFFIKDGLAIFSKSKSYLRIGTIESKTNITFDSFEIFIKDKNKEKVVFTSNDDNYTLLSEYGYDEIFIYKNLNIIEGNTYIKIKYQDKEDIVKLNFQRDMTNNFFTTNREKDVIEDEAKYDFDDIQKLESYVKKNWSYDNEKDCYVYTYSDSNKVKYNVLYHLNSQSLVIEEYENDLKKIVEISFVRNSLVYSEEKQENLNEKFRYDFNSQKCINGECDDEQIKYYLDNYLNKYMK